MRWLLYALGGGLGHLTRSCSLARAATRQGIQCSVLTNSSHARLVRRHLDDEIDIVTLSAQLDRHGVKRAVQKYLASERCDTLIVDTFARGLAGELQEPLSQLSCRKVFVHRDVAPAYVHDCDLGRFIQAFDVVLSPGELGPLGGVLSAPWLILDHEELWSPQRARMALSVHDDRPVVLVVATGTATEIAELTAAAETLRAELPNTNVRLASPHARLQHWPLLQLMAGVDAVVGAGGYNTVYESRATGRPLLALARRRLYDRQRRRLSSEERLSDLLIEAPPRIRALAPSQRPITPYDNGAHAAVQTILEAA